MQGQKGETVQIFGTTLTHQNAIQEEIKSRLKLGNTCYHLIQKCLPVYYTEI